MKRKGHDLNQAKVRYVEDWLWSLNHILEEPQVRTPFDLNNNNNNNNNNDDDDDDDDNNNNFPVLVFRIYNSII